MHLSSSVRALGLDEASIAKARAEGHVVGRGEGFVSREWRGDDGVGLAVHADAGDRETSCAQPFLAGLPWDEWSLVSVRPGASCPHCSTALLRAGDVELEALLPDYAARRKMFPVGLDVRATAIVVVEEWRPGERLPLAIAPVEGDRGAVVVSGRVGAVAPVGSGGVVRASVGGERHRVWLVGRAPAELRAGSDVTASGRAIVRIGAPRVVRGPSTAPRTGS